MKLFLKGRARRAGRGVERAGAGGAPARYVVGQALVLAHGHQAAVACAVAGALREGNRLLAGQRSARQATKQTSKLTPGGAPSQGGSRRLRAYSTRTTCRSAAAIRLSASKRTRAAVILAALEDQIRSITQCNIPAAQETVHCVQCYVTHQWIIALGWTTCPLAPTGAELRQGPPGVSVS